MVMTRSTKQEGYPLVSGRFSKHEWIMSFNAGIAVLIMLFLTTGSAIALADDLSGTIKAVTIECKYTVEIPKPVSEKLENTLQKTLERILVETDGRGIESYSSSKVDVEGSIKDGLNIVLEPKGYSIESLDLEFAGTTIAHFIIKPFSKYCKEINISLDAGNFHPFWIQHFTNRFNESLDEIKSHYGPFLIGLPVGAEDNNWAFNFVRDDSYKKDYFMKMFPDMEIGISIDVEETTQVVIDLKPSGNVVKTLRVRSYSRSLFQMTIDSFKELITSNSNVVVGMPIPLVKDFHGDIETEFARLVSEDQFAKRFQAVPECRLYFMEREPFTAFLELSTESDTFHLNAEAIVDAGNNQNATMFRGHIGTTMGHYFEIFTRLNFFPDDVRFRPDLGVGLHPLRGTMLAAGWDIANGSGKLYAEQFLNRDIHIEAEFFAEYKGQNQYGFVYKPFQFVSFGVFTDGDDDYWLRTAFAF